MKKSSSPSSGSILGIKKRVANAGEVSRDADAKSRFLRDLEKTPIQCNILSLAEIAIALDDVLVKGWKENFKRTDIVLGCNVAANLIAMVMAIYSWKVGFEASYAFGPALCIIYFLIVLTLAGVNWFLGPPPKFHGHNGKESIKVQSAMEAPSTTYSITVTYHIEGSREPKIVYFKKPIETWFYSNGFLSSDAIYADLQLLCSK